MTYADAHLLQYQERVGKLAPQFMGYRQQDCQEFLRFLVDGLHEDLNQDPDPEALMDMVSGYGGESDVAVMAREAWARHCQEGRYSVVTEIFGGQLSSRVTCMHCGHSSCTFDPFYDLSLPIPAGKTEECGLSDCLEAFTFEEVLDGEDAYWCEVCCSHRKASKQLRIRRCAPVLVIHVKRFSYTSTVREKLETNMKVGHYS